MSGAGNRVANYFFHNVHASGALVSTKLSCFGRSIRLPKSTSLAAPQNRDLRLSPMFIFSTDVNIRNMVLWSRIRLQIATFEDFLEQNVQFAKQFQMKLVFS